MNLTDVPPSFWREWTLVIAVLKGEAELDRATREQWTTDVETYYARQKTEEQIWRKRNTLTARNS